jgi:hypothetical protein
MYDKFKVLTAVTVRSSVPWYNAVQTVRSLLTLPLGGFVIGLLFYPEGGGIAFFQHIDRRLSDYTVIHLKNVDYMSYEQDGH